MRQNFSLAVIYELPFGKGRPYGGGANRAKDAALGGWIVNSIFQAHSGLALTVWDAPERTAIFGALLDAFDVCGATTPDDIPAGPPFLSPCERPICQCL